MLATKLMLGAKALAAVTALAVVTGAAALPAPALGSLTGDLPTGDVAVPDTGAAGDLDLVASLNAALGGLAGQAGAALSGDDASLGLAAAGTGAGIAGDEAKLPELTSTIDSSLDPQDPRVTHLSQLTAEAGDHTGKLRVGSVLTDEKALSTVHGTVDSADGDHVGAFVDPQVCPPEDEGALASTHPELNMTVEDQHVQQPMDIVVPDDAGLCPDDGLLN